MGTATFNHTGGWQQWPVPNGVTSVEVALNGAGVPASGQNGGRVTGRLAVKKGDVLWIGVPGKGEDNDGHTGGQGGWPGGADGGNGVNHPGGQGGGGYAVIRLNSASGTVKAVAAGAGGASGDAGDGGQGGTDTGASGHRGSAGTGQTSHATGGTQNQGGERGTSSAGPGFIGHDGSDNVLGPAGKGGGTNEHNGPGGGGGGGGYHGGGGGCGGLQGVAPGEGGAGGSNFTGGLTSHTSGRGTGASGNGSITLTWSTPSPGDQRPNTPSIQHPSQGARLGDYSVTIKAEVSDPDSTRQVRMRILLSNKDDFSNPAGPFFSDYVDSGDVAKFTRTGIAANVHQHARVWAQDKAGQLSLNYAAVHYFSNYAPTEPTLVSPAAGASVTGDDPTVFDWTPHDPDGQPQAAADHRYWREVDDEPNYHTARITGPSSTWTVGADVFKANNFYKWQVRTRDLRGLWGPWSLARRFFVTGSHTAPVLVSPIKDEAVSVGDPLPFRWKFRDPNQGDQQAKADLRYKAVVADDSSWVTLLGTTTTPGATERWVLPQGRLYANRHYEWQARTYDEASGGVIPSDWSESATFKTVVAVGSHADDLVPFNDDFVGSLDCGINYAFLAVKGGHRLLGALNPATSITYSRVRDDISKCVVRMPITKEGRVCQLASLIRSWQHEIVIYRRTAAGVQRVWEGPVTRVEYGQGYVEVEARDVMVWLFRRIMKQGFNDAYPYNQSVIVRAARLIMNGLADDDPRILQYLTLIENDDDAVESRVRHDWQSTVWGEVDDMAANAGLDYTTVGRRIILWDTHRPIGRLPLLRSDDFSAPPVLSEYGMSMATTYGVTDGSGIYGAAYRDATYTGPVEMLVSAYGEQVAGQTTARTREAARKLRETFAKQARRGIAARFPTPLAVRVPDNTSLRPTAPVPLQYLVPGVWAPLQADHTCRTISQWQKLDSVTVVQAAETAEQVQVVLSPAPNGGGDPDQEAAIEEAAGA